jgi:tRNA(Arg) A34 adenosine deaminase TadA
LQVHTAKTPTAHGEICTINGYFHKTPDAERMPAGDTIFLATHQPCSLCMSGIAFAGFR